MKTRNNWQQKRFQSHCNKYQINLHLNAPFSSSTEILCLRVELLQDIIFFNGLSTPLLDKQLKKSLLIYLIKFNKINR